MSILLTKMNKRNLTSKSSNSKTIQSTSVVSHEPDEELNDNEEILFELEECLSSKEAMLKELKDEADNVETDIKRFTTPYNSETGTLEEDISMLRSIASKYVKQDLINFYVDRIQKSASNNLGGEPSTISALCQLISDGEDL